MPPIGVSCFEGVRVALLVGAYLFCALSFYCDPLAPTNSGPAGYLGLSIDHGLSIRKLCKTFNVELQQCLSAATETDNTLIDSGIFQKAATLAKERSRGGKNRCAVVATKAEECNVKATTTALKIRIVCRNEVTSHWECIQNCHGDQLCCQDEMKIVKDCSQRVANSEMRDFGASF